jgi:hypothetical protein
MSSNCKKGTLKITFSNKKEIIYNIKDYKKLLRNILKQWY